MPLKATLGGETAAGGGGLLTPTIEPQLQIIFFFKVSTTPNFKSGTRAAIFPWKHRYTQ